MMNTSERTALIWAAFCLGVLAAVFGSEFFTGFAFARFMITHNMLGFVCGLIWAAVAFAPIVIVEVT